MALDKVKNFVRVTVDGGYTSSDTSINLVSGDGAKLPAVPFNLVWYNATDYPDVQSDPDKEIVRVTAISTDTLTVERGQEGTTAVGHNTAGKTYKMIQDITKKMIDDIDAHITDTSNPHSVTKAQVGLGNVTNDLQEKAANKEVANGYAGLDANLKVIRNPANATATPTASKIPIANAYGLLNDGWTGLVVNVKNYGAKGDGTTDDTTAIQNAIDSMTAGDMLFIPAGTYKITNIVFDPPSGSSLLCLGTLKSAASGIAFNIGESGSTPDTRERYRIINLKVISDSIDWTAGRIGIKVVNIYESYIDIRRVSGFEKDIEFLGTNSHGCVYNETHLGRVYNGKKSLFLTADTDGWCNENTFYGGRFYWESSITDYTDTVHLTVDYYSTHILNNNRFVNPSFEGGDSSSTMASISGKNIYIYTPRLENTGTGIVWESNSQDCVVFYGYGVNADLVTDNGTNNVMFSGNPYILPQWTVGGANGINRLTANQSSAETDLTGVEASKATLSRTTTSGEYYTGTAGFKLVSNQSSATDMYLDIGNAKVAIEGGKTYLFSAYVKSNTTAKNWTLRIYWFDSSDDYIKNDSMTAEAASTSWKRLHLRATAPSNAAFGDVMVRLYAADNALPDTIYIDDMMFVAEDDMPQMIYGE